ncbi:MAG TPA: SIMPL domain-containing protein [Gemmatimonadaceae bacterium]
MRARVLLLCTVVGCAPLTAQQPGAPGAVSVAPAPVAPQIATSAVGESRVTPDRALIDIGVQTRAATAEQAGAENARRVQAVLAALRALGLGADQLSTVNYNVYPETRFEQGDREPRIVGYNVVNSVRAELRRQEQVGPAIDAALKAGANVINSLSFYASDPAPARRLALQQAVEKARGDAQALAQAAGGRLGRLLELSTSEGMRPPQPMYRLEARGMAADAASTPIEPGQQTVTVTVFARWEFLAGTE